MLGKSPERDREIDDICQMIRNASRAGIPALKYNMTLHRRRAHGHRAGPRRRALQHVRVRQGRGRSAALTKPAVSTQTPTGSASPIFSSG